jgi:Na+-driven multidrug efflux pump
METTACTLVGNCLGRGDAKNALTYMKCVSFVALIISSALTYFMHINFSYIVGILTNLDSLIEKSEEVKIMVLINIVPDIMMSCLRGGIKAMGL